ncbi:MAG: lipolytic protein G-D-S-L family [Mucilaginibacter sp.]|nr:lipolytic protein G-D-S-L family [Mucilaginibacter sp.]
MNFKKATAVLVFAILFNTLVTFAQKRDVNLVFIGNSITYGAGLPDRATQAPPAICVDYLKTKDYIGAVDFSNQGHSGYTTLDWLPGTKAFIAAEAAAKEFSNTYAQLVFSIKIGTNDSAVKGPHGAPVSVENYRDNLVAIIEQLLTDFPGCKIILQHPIWYSPNTYNGSMYLQEGLTRMQTYMPVIDDLVDTYKVTNPNQLYVGDTKAFNYFKKNYLTDFQPENGKQGTFYLHPNLKGAVSLGEFWGKAIARILQ